VEGELLSYVYEQKDWVPILQDVPFGLEDTLYSDQDARAEIVFPNSTWIRIGGNTQIQAIALDEDVTEIDVASGIARFYNRGSQGVIKATTPFGFVLAPAGSMFDLYVGDESVEVIALRESVDFVHATGQSRYEVQSGSSSLVADNRVVAAGQGMVDAEFDDWNGQRDSLWAKRLEVKGDSIRYLPPQMRDDAYELEENGRWDRVQYQGEYRNLWRPTRVGPEWRPYTYGRWTSYYGDQCWVPSEPFGYTTHHYGNWVFIDRWYWAPPVASVNVIVGRPWTVGYGWYPGRVSWLYSDTNVGWVPLAPYEPYYANRYWGPSSVAVATMNLAASVINLVALSNLDHAVFVGRRDFWGVNNYHTHVVKNINKTTIINNYYGSPVVDRRVIRDFDDRRDRFHYVNRDVKFKPHRSVVERIDRNQRLAVRQERIEAQALLRDTRNVRRGDVDRGVKMERPRVTNRLVSADSVDRPASELKFQQRELKRQEREQRAVDQRVLRQQQQLERREGSERTRPERPSRDTPDQRRIERDERLQQQQERRQMREEREQTRPERPDADQRQQQREERQRQLEERRQLREQTRPERPDTDQRQQQREERQRQLEERRQLREQTRPERPDTDQRQQQREERQRQLEERRQPRQDREQTRPERPDTDQQRQMREERQRQQREQQQQQTERQQQEQRRQQQQQQQRQQREQEQQLRQQQQMERQQQEQRRQMRDDRQQQQQQRQQREQEQQLRQQQQQQQRQQREQEQQLRQQQQMERQQQQQERRQMRDDRQQQLQQQQQRQQREKEQQQQNRRRPKGQEEQPQEGAQTQ
jgi:hypothetical protein